MCSGSGYFDRAFHMLLTVNLREVIVDFAGNESRFGGNRLLRRAAAQDRSTVEGEKPSLAPLGRGLNRGYARFSILGN